MNVAHPEACDARTGNPMLENRLQLFKSEFVGPEDHLWLRESACMWRSAWE